MPHYKYSVHFEYATENNPKKQKVIEVIASSIVDAEAKALEHWAHFCSDFGEPLIVKLENMGKVDASLDEMSDKAKAVQKRYNIKILDRGSFVLPAGDYFITDPCYVLDEGTDELWPFLCEYVFKESKVDVVFTFEQYTIWVGSTAHGDGEYDVRSTMGLGRLGTFGVDAGLFAILPQELVNLSSKYDNYDDLGTRVTLPGGPITYNDGNMTTKGIRVITR